MEFSEQSDEFLFQMRNFMSAEGVRKSTALPEMSAPRIIFVIIFGEEEVQLKQMYLAKSDLDFIPFVSVCFIQIKHVVKKAYPCKHS